MGVLWCGILSVSVSVYIVVWLNSVSFCIWFFLAFNWQKSTFLINQSVVRSIFWKKKKIVQREEKKIILHHQGNNWAIKILRSILMLDKMYFEWYTKTFALFGWYKNETWTEKSISLSYSPLTTRTHAFSINRIVSQVSMLVKFMQYLNKNNCAAAVQHNTNSKYW